MPVTDLLERNHKLYGDEVALVELNPLMKDTRKTTWKEYDLVQQTSPVAYRREITWSVFDEKANRVANMLLGRGIKKGDRVAILMFNCLEWLPIYFGILKTGAIAVPFNFRFSADEIQYCADLAQVHILFFGSEFIGRIESIADELQKGRLLIYVGDGCPTLQRAIGSWLQTAQARRLLFDLRKRTMRQSIFHLVRPDFQRPFYIITRACLRRHRWSKSTI